MLIVKSSKNKDQLLLDGYCYRRANQSHTAWRCCRSNYVGRVRFDGTGYVKVSTFHFITRDLYFKRARALFHF